MARPAFVIAIAIAIGSAAACGGSTAVTPTAASWCTDGAPVLLARGANGPVRSVGLDSTHIYWSDGGSNAASSIRRTPKIGGATETLVTLTPGGSGVALSDDSIIYGATASTSSGYGLYALAKSGGTPVLLADVQVGMLAVSGAAVVFVRGTDGTLMAVPISGGVPTVLWTSPSGFPNLAAVDDDAAYVIDEPHAPPYAVYRVPLRGGASATKLLEAPYIRALALRDHSLYVTTYDPTGATVSISMVPAAGGAATVIASVPAMSIGLQGTLLAVDATSLYTDQGGNAVRIVSIPRAGGASTPTDATGGAQGIYTLSVDDAAIYWGAEAELGGGSLMRLCK